MNPEQEVRKNMPAKRQPNIDISLEGVGRRAPRPSGIDIPLSAPRGSGNILDPKLEDMVNRHHQEVKELHRRARQGR